MSGDSSNPSLAILLVEDHADTASVIRSFLSTRGHVVEIANSVEAAVKCVVEQKFDLIISDIGLPDGNGVSLINGIRQFCKTPAIAITGYGADADIERCIKAGFDRHLAKPLNPEKLLEAIDMLMGGNGADRPPAPAAD
ncbi:MAG: response regulator [Thermomicrobiales bacterium]